MNRNSKINASNVNYSYWEIKHYFGMHDLVVIGSGIVGLSTAISFAQKNKKARILIIERGILPSGASTKNAGFACFGSPSELLDDLENMPEKTVWKTVEMRWEGLQLLEKRLGAKNIQLQWMGGYELFDKTADFERCCEKIEYLNMRVQKSIGLKNTYSNDTRIKKNFGKIKGAIKNKYEGQLDTGLMMKCLTELAVKNGIKIITGVPIKRIYDLGSSVEMVSEAGVFKSKKVVVATNGFATQLLKIGNVKPARAQVMVTKPIAGLKIKGCFHFDRGYYYFRNIDGRILLGGGRNLDFTGETTTEMRLNPLIQAQLDKLMKEIVLPGTHYEVETRWSGIMGVGNEKKPIIELVSPNVLAAVRMGGMGVAIGSLVGKLASEKIADS